MMTVDFGDTFRCSDETDEFDFLHAPIFKDVNGGDGRSSRGKDWIENKSY